MSLLSFVKEAGEKLIDLLTPGNANASEQLKEHVAKVGLGNPNVQTTVDGDKVTVTGEVATQEEKEKILLALGNIAGVASVDDQITVSGPAVAAARFVVVKKGDTLSAISLTVYGANPIPCAGHVPTRDMTRSATNPDLHRSSKHPQRERGI